MPPPPSGPTHASRVGLPRGRGSGRGYRGCCRAAHTGWVGGHGYSKGQWEKRTHRCRVRHEWLLGGHGTTHLSLTMARMCMRVCICKGMHTYALTHDTHHASMHGHGERIHEDTTFGRRTISRSIRL